VRAAALKCNIQKFDKYCILGDDIIIADDSVAKAYLAIMENLGVTVNLSKSLISNKFAEFAKKFLGPNNIDISPIGPGLILRSMRNKIYSVRLLMELIHSKLVLLVEVREALKSFPNFLKLKKDGFDLMV
jgi:hypothetical protein